jgi:glutamate dehydrogenase (NAD/NADP) (EC 1.4.1.3)
MATPFEEVASSSLLSQEIKRLYNTGRLLGLDDETIEALATPERVLEVKMTVRLKDGRVRTFVGWRSQHNSALGPYKGGVRYHPSSTRDEVVALSMMMTWKNSLLLLPFGGGKGGIRVDPKTLDKEDLEKLSRKYIQQIYMYIGSDKDIPAPDVNTDSQVMAWFLDEYIKVTGRQDFGAFTGNRSR